MEKFGMNFGGGPSKKDLLETIESQKKQLLNYQARLKDVVIAYKSLINEKEALEASLKVLSASHEADIGLSSAQPTSVASSSSSFADSADDKSSVHSEDSVGTATSADTAASLASTKGEQGTEDEKPAAAAPSLKSEETNGSESGVSTSSGDVPPAAAEADKRVLQLKTQLATLTSALSTVTQEKSRMEASYQADKKKMKQDLDDAIKKAEDETDKLETELRSVQEQLAETKARLITQQHDRAQEQSDHAVMLRELQKLLQSERALRQDAELKLEETREALAGRVSVADRAEGYELQIRQLSQEVEDLKRELQAVQEERKKPDPRVQDLQEEMASLKNHFQSQLLQEMRKTAQAEEQLRQHAQMEEQRVADLEGQVSEVSGLLGTYEKAKQKDQLVIQKLKDRIVQLDQENKTLAVAASSRSPLDVSVEEANLDVNVLKDKMEKLKKLLQAAAKKSQPALDIEKLCELEPPKGTEAADGEKATALYYQQELKQLKEEFERYKMRAQVVLKNKSLKDVNLAKELEEAQEQLADLKEKYVVLQLSAEETEKRHQLDMEAKKQELSHLQQLHRQELERCQLDYRERALKLEEEMHKQRDRALAVLAEKDQELEQLRSITLPYAGLQGSKTYGASGADVASDDTPANDASESLPQALHLSANSEPTFFLYAEQLARKEVEIAALRKQKHKLEMEVHRLQEKVLVEEEKHREEVSALQDEIQKNFRDKSREGANLEYLKNIVYRFLTLPDSLGRQQTLTAILTILHFSPEEKQTISKQSAYSSWWPSGKR
ncbi:GRIP and coiled-coil domain-containing protein 1 [Cygnus atratus]|uniref:GRIP and coiled-coil domain-containing protein 1 n=1 Tax=Cygnus atratus TaxID=8868 RepID=UPI0015D6470A|nr:GRIP and coiled-coil domain-containing protein 1 [Cygnus atratus]XP_050568428.1 GRIP and coiled-coil domain-containing protein 1 [Cygnus atratus]XP_050568431.1 GRIP and coiled-coil domain-containing protein 1 [Cygnus atratus]